MINPCTKTCNHCKDVVAIKHFIRFHTVKNYITIHGSDVTTYANWEDNDTPYKLHYCRECWDKICGAVKDF